MPNSNARPLLGKSHPSQDYALRQLFAILLAAGLSLFFSSPAAGGQSADATPDELRTDELRKLNESVDALVKKVSPSIVQILVTGYGPLEQGDRGNTSSVIGRQRAIGSGFVIDPSGYIVTNAHVVNGAQRVQVEIGRAHV